MIASRSCENRWSRFSVSSDVRYKLVNGLKSRFRRTALGLIIELVVELDLAHGKLAFL
jgi:hypothetical protein